MDSEAGRKKMKAWTTDASGVVVGGEEDMPHSPSALKRFLDERVGSLERILIAPKGYGKTLHLKYKSYLVRNKQGRGIPTFPNQSLDIEYLKLTADAREMRADVGPLTVDKWSVAWQFVLIGKGLQMLDGTDGLDTRLTSFFRSKAKAIGDMLTEVIRDRDNFDANVSDGLRLVRQSFNDQQRDVIIFVENTDEMFVGLDRLELLRPRKGKTTTSEVTPSNTAAQDGENHEPIRELDAEASNENARQNPSMWKAAQLGLMLAIREIERSAPKLCVYTTLRAEALGSIRHSETLQARGTYTVDIRYTEKDLEQIFAWHVARMDPSDLVDPTQSHPAHRLMGRDPIQHRYVREGAGPAFEDPFNLLLRHTTNSPRDLIEIGRRIASLAVDERTGPERAENIRGAIDSAVCELFDYFRANSIPRWEDAWDDAIGRIPTPVLDEETLNRVLGPSLAAKVYAFGFLGVAEATVNPREYRQLFLTRWSDSYASDDVQLPKSKYYFLHPWLHDAAKKNNRDFARDMTTIIGNRCLYREPGPMRLRVAPDINGAPALFHEDQKFDCPVGNSGSLSMNPAFFFAYLLSCAHFQTNRISEDQLRRGTELLRERYGRFLPHKLLDPFNDREHAAHVQSKVVEAFPQLFIKLARIQWSLRVVRSNGSNEPTVVVADFIDIQRLVVEPALDG